MNRREKWLGIGLATLLGAFLVFEPIRNSTFGSSDVFYQDMLAAKRKLQSLENENLIVQREMNSLEAMRSRSLPNDPAMACVKYQEYLIRCLETSGLKSPIVTGASPIPMDGVGVKVHFTVQASATSAQIGSFLDHFFATDTLHQINFLTVYQSGGPDAVEHAMSVGIEVLVLEGNRDAMPNLTPHRKTNGAAKALAANDIFRRPSKPTEPIAEASMLTSILQSFSSEVKQPTEMVVTTTVEVPAMPEPVAQLQAEPKETVRLIGVIERGKSRVALFYDSQTGKQAMVEVNGSLQELGIDANVQQIDKDSVQLDIGDSKQQLKLGKRIVDTGPAINSVH